MSFARDITPEEAAFGFEHDDRAEGRVVTATLGNGLRAVKIVEHGVVSYAICDDHFVMLYRPARSLEELEARFGSLGESRKTG